MTTNDEINEINEWITAHEPINHDGSYVPISEVRRLLILRGNEARADERAKQDATYKIHEKYHELQDKDIAKKAKQEQLAEDMRKFKKLFVDNENDDPFEVTLEDVLHALQQSKAKSD